MTSKACHLFIVATNKRHLCAPLQRAFRGQDEVQVILDRRQGERRRVLEPAASRHGTERRRGERRAQTDAQGKLARLGLVLVEVAAAARVVSPAVDFLHRRRRVS